MKFPTAGLLKGMKAVYEDVLTLCYVGCIGSFVSVIWLIVVIIRKRHAK